MKLSFHGAARGVTGSCHMLEAAGKKLLIDCGLYQGNHQSELENSADFGFDPATIDYLLLTHAHLDHCGRIPLLTRRGFQGEIITTAASRELARLIMMDSAGINEEEARYQARRAARRGKHADAIQPLYSLIDALASLDYFGRVATYNNPITVCKGIQATYFDAGHILGSANILLTIDEGGNRKRLLFSGDLGNSQRPILRDPSTPPKADIVVMETTYGDRAHKNLRPSVQELYDVINATFKRGGNVIIPSFALERSQELLFYLREGIEKDLIKRTTPVFLDSPMAISATEIFKRHKECYDDETSELFARGRDPFSLPGLSFTRETQDSMAINRIVGGAIIIAGSGMCEGGRIRHHLKHHLWRADCSIVFVGYAAQGTLARRIIDGAEMVNIFGEQFPVRAHVHTIGGFSAHADQQELLNWHRHTGQPDQTFLVHGEPDAINTFAKHLQNCQVEIPSLHQSYPIA